MLVRKLALAVALAAIGLSTAYAAEDAVVESGTPAPMAPMTQDCVKPAARHDHGAEKGTPTPISAKCAMAADAATQPADKAKAKAKMGHDHARFHKLM